MGLITGALLIAAILLWSRLRKAEQRIGRLEEQVAIGFVPPVEEPAPSPVAKPQRITLRNAHVPPPIAAPPSDPEPVREPAWQPRTIAFEELFGSKLPIWAGGITLAVAALFIVKYSIDTGLLSPAVRVVLGLLFAAALVAGAEVARRWKATAFDPRVAQALAGAGVAAAYAVILVATNLYALVGPGAGFAGLAFVTAVALGLALRFGAPSAVLGLVGGLAAPALVGEAPGHVPALVAYLALAIAALGGVARHRKWRWLAYAALGGGFGWGLILIMVRGLDSTNGPALGAYLLLLGFAIPFVAIDKGARRLIRAIPPAVAALQIALIVEMGGHSALHWGFYGLLSVATIILARIDRGMAPVPPIALLVGLAAMIGWNRPDPALLVLVTGTGMAIFALPALIDLWRARGTVTDAAQAALALGGGLAVASLVCPPGVLSDAQWGWLAIVLALPLAGVALIGARRDTPARDPSFAVLVTAAMLGLLVGLSQIVGVLWLGIGYAVALALTVEAARRRRDLDYRGALIVALVALLAAIAQPLMDWLAGAAFTLFGEPLAATALPDEGDAVLRLGLPAIIAGAAAWRGDGVVRPALRLGALVGAGAVLTGAVFILYKQAFGIGGGQDFVARGMAERILFTQLLFAGGWVAWRWAGQIPALRWAALGLTALGLLRSILYDALLFDPLWRAQMVGPVPIANLITAAFLLPICWLALAAREEPEIASRVRPIITGVQMLFVALWVSASVRHLYHGSLLPPGGVGAGEDMARSFAAILMALGFLGWGIHAKARAWRIASLVLMIGAVGKVFLVDAAGLDGLLRIASFVALGFSLIGIGWLYSRFLRADEDPVATMATGPSHQKV